jgi:predicted membrane GTPase involved in stress response
MTVLNSRVELVLEQCLDFIENDEQLEVYSKKFTVTQTLFKQT